MQGLHKSVILAVAMAWSASALCGLQAESDPGTFTNLPSPHNVVIAQRTNTHITFFSGSRLNSNTREVHAAGASFIKLHFSHFKLPKGIVVEISNPDGSETWRYSANKRDQFTHDASLGDDGDTSFSAMSITGDTALIRLTGNQNLFKPGVHLLKIDSFQQGLPSGDYAGSEKKLNKSKGIDESQIENACGAEQRYGAACWASDYPWEYARSAATVRLITSRGEVCTAWRVGSDNHLFTAEHCLSKQSELDGAEIWFNYQAATCGSSQNLEVVKVTGGSLLANDRNLDFSLFTVNDFSSIAVFPAFGLDVSGSEIGQTIWIPQHGLGQPRQISLESDMNNSGVCEVDALNLDGYAEESDIGYYCDTTTSSSGSPVVDYESGRVIALHHFGGCLNAGVKISRIWPEVSGFFGGEVPNGSKGQGGGSGNQSPQAELNASCDELSCSFDASGSSDPDGTISSYTWVLSDGSDSSAASFEHEFAEEGSYEVSLTVEDNDGDSGSQSQTLTVSVPNQEPVAIISTSCINNSCQFNANGSYDSDGTINAWDWSLGDGSQAQGENIEHEYSAAGSYTVTLTVEDDAGAADNSSRTVTLNMPNEDPAADYSFSCTELDCSFDAGSSSDPDGSISTWNWTFGDGSSASGSQVNHSYTEGGTYSVTLSVTDDDGATGDHSKDVTVVQGTNNENPVANFTFSCTELDCNFNAGGSSDADGTVVNWQWAFGDGSSGSGSQVSHSYHEAGAYTVTLTVEDNEGAIATASKPATVEKPNVAPLADFTFNCDKSRCEFDGGTSVDPDGQINSWQWSFGDGNSASGPSVSHVFAATGTYSVSLTVEDAEGSTDTRTRNVTPEKSNSIPTASFSYQCNETSCRFDADNSSDSDGNIVSYSWSLGDGSSAGGEVVEHDFSGAGSFAVTLTVEDDQGDTDSRARTVTVKEKPATDQEKQLEIVLIGEGGRYNGRSLATLRWSGAETDTVAIYRDGDLVAVTGNDGKHIDMEIDSWVKSANYRLCQPSTNYCSNLVSLSFAP